MSFKSTQNSHVFDCISLKLVKVGRTVIFSLSPEAEPTRNYIKAYRANVWDQANNTMQSSKVSQLQVMFPDMDAGTISSVLGAKNDNVDQAIEALLALNVTTLSEEDKKRAKDSNFNEVLQKVNGEPSFLCLFVLNRMYAGSPDAQRQHRNSSCR